MLFRCLAFGAFLFVGSLSLTASLSAAEPLPVQIDKLIAAAADGPVGARSSDAEFVRRLWLDLAGVIPPAAEVEAFLADKSNQKRAQLIDRLLAADTYARHMQDLWDVTLLERRGIEGPWRSWLLESFAANKPWNQMVREMLNPDSENEETRHSAMFIHKHLERYGQNPSDMPGLIRDVSRLMLGKDIQCAQCHDHPFVNEYLQRDYQGLMAFLGHVNMRRDLDFAAVYEKPLNKPLEYESVFILEKEMVGPRLPDGKEHPVMTLKAAELYAVPANKETKAPGVPKFRTLPILAEEMTRQDHRQFNRTIANRLWFIMMGRGLVHPLDMDHAENPASHPQLIDLLTDEFVAHGYDIKWMLRQLALSETYQRTSQLPAGVEVSPPDRFRYALEKPISADTLMWSMLSATEMQTAFMPVVPKQAAPKEQPKSKLDALRPKFLAAFANPPAEPEQEFNATVRASLFVLNSDEILGWLNPQPGNLVERLAKLTDDKQVAEQLYLAVLSRQPDEEERGRVAEFLAKHKEDRARSIGQMAWALMASTEFSLNH